MFCSVFLPDQNLYWQVSLPQMYMQALLGPATVGRQMLFVQVTFDSMSNKKFYFLITYFYS
jgi:hypothetical protein